MVRSPHVRFACLALAAIALGGASSGSCIPHPLPFFKSSDASDPAADVPGGDFATLSTCASFATFRLVADPVLQRMCMACHATGGRGAGKLLFQQSTLDEDEKVAKNYFASLSHLAEDDQGNIDSNPILGRLNGTISHDITLDIAGDDYNALRTWVAEERELACQYAPTTPAE